MYVVIKYSIKSPDKNETDSEKKNQNKLKEDNPNSLRKNEKDSNFKNDSESVILVKLEDKDYASLILKLTN